MNPALVRLIQEEAEPAIRRVLGRKFRIPAKRLPEGGSGARDALDCEDVCAAAKEKIIRRLSADPSASSQIANLGAYAAQVALSAWTEHLRAKHPQRYTVELKLRYLLSGRSAQKGFALWEDDSGRSVAGFSAWSGRAAVDSAAYYERIASPEMIEDAAAQANDPAGQIAALLRAFDGPVFLDDLVRMAAGLWGACDSTESMDGTQREIAGPTPPPDDKMRWEECLRWLWQELVRMPLKHRTAFLLHSEVIHQFEPAGATSVRQIAAALAMPVEELASLWNDLPLDDLAIAARLGAARQEVINFRSLARRRLKPLLERFLN
jgi:hypothetical protein